MYETIEIKVLANYKIWVKFNDGEERVIDILPFLNKGIAKELLDIKKNNEVKIDSGGGIYWANGYDFCPNYLKTL
jgi:Protein of unknown function (DUF2442)